MENGVDVEGDKVKIMGATGNSNTTNITRLTVLQERKKHIEDSLLKCNQELKEICLQEADLTGLIPQEMPLEPGESPPLLRRRVGATYQLPESLIKNNSNKDETVTELELQIQLHANLAEAALGLANEHNISKTLRRQHMTDYHQHKMQFINLQDKLTTVKDKVLKEHKQKKKPRPPEEDNISTGTNPDSFVKSDLRHSLRTSKTSIDGDVELRYPASYPRVVYGDGSYMRMDESMTRGLYALSINGYKSYMERRETVGNINGFNTLPYNQNSPHYSYYPLYPPRSNPVLYNPSIPNQNYGMKSPSQRLQHKQSSPNLNTPKIYYSQTLDSNYRIYPQIEQNPHQIQPHQQYEHMSSGLGGYWKRLENGETVWCNSSPVENWQADKRFGSLDRRKNKRLQKRISPSVDNKSVCSYADHVRTTALKSPQVIIKRGQDRQLVRTQSLGSVGGQTIDSVWPSDDNSSCESDNRSINGLPHGSRRHKQKEWIETSLDGPVSPVSQTHSVISRSQSALPSVLSPEEKYISTPPPPLLVQKPLEIPAESNPCPRIPETNLELFNNNIPKNCTVVQAGHCKPYHEETKPFEMSDFYKYSTKFKKSPVKNSEESRPRTLSDSYSKNNNNFSPVSSLSSNRMDNSFDISQISNANVAEHFSDEMNAWYKSQKLQIDNNGSAGSSKPKSTATLV